MMDSEEVLDLVDGDNQVIGKIKRGDLNSLTPGGGRYVRSADIFIMREDQRIWVPVRNKQKSIAPGGLDYSVGGHVASGESYEATVVRELKEEADIEATIEELELVAIIKPERLHFAHLYLLRAAQQPKLSDEHTNGSWMTLDELQHRLEHGTNAKESLLPNLKRLRQYLNDKSGQGQ